MKALILIWFLCGSPHYVVAVQGQNYLAAPYSWVESHNAELSIVVNLLNDKTTKVVKMKWPHKGVCL